MVMKSGGFFYQNIIVSSFFPRQNFRRFLGDRHTALSPPPIAFTIALRQVDTATPLLSHSPLKEKALRIFV